MNSLLRDSVRAYRPEPIAQPSPGASARRGAARTHCRRPRTLPVDCPAYCRQASRAFRLYHRDWLSHGASGHLRRALLPARPGRAPRWQKLRRRGCCHRPGPLDPCRHRGWPWHLLDRQFRSGRACARYFACPKALNRSPLRPWAILPTPYVPRNASRSLIWFATNTGEVDVPCALPSTAPLRKSPAPCT